MWLIVGLRGSSGVGLGLEGDMTGRVPVDPLRTDGVGDPVVEAGVAVLFTLRLRGFKGAGPFPTGASGAGPFPVDPSGAGELGISVTFPVTGAGLDTLAGSLSLELGMFEAIIMYITAIAKEIPKYLKNVAALVILKS